MKTFEASFRPLAEADLFGLYDDIAGEAGTEVAGGCIDRIEAACMALRSFPERGTARDDIRPGLRTIGVERRATVVFEVTDTDVVIVRILYGGQDFERALKASSETQCPSRAISFFQQSPRRPMECSLETLEMRRGQRGRNFIKLEITIVILTCGSCLSSP